MKDKNGTATAPFSEIQARLGESLTKYDQLRGFL
jgi:hypothetical protein